MSLNAGVLNHPCLQAIFVKRFYVSLPTIFLQSEEEYKRRGRYSTGDPDIDKAVYNERTRTYMTINEMFELWKIGCTVGLVRYDDAKAVYEAIEEHLSRWYNFMTRGFNLSTCPFDELLDLDRFANVVYDKAKYTFTRESMKPFENMFSSLGINVQAGGFFKKGGTYMFGHKYKSDFEKEYEKDRNTIQYAERPGYEEAIVQVASRYDFSLNGSKENLKGKPEDDQFTVQPLSTNLKFGND
jgi:hypothetical protein